MAIVRIPRRGDMLSDDAAIAAFLSQHNIEFERWSLEDRVSPDADSDAILAAYAPEIERLKGRGGYVTADVIDVKPDTAGLDEMLNRFNKEHRHADDEVRFVVQGRGVFHIHPAGGDVFSIEVHPGEFITVPAGTRHWFDLCIERRTWRIRARVLGPPERAEGKRACKGVQAACIAMSRAGSAAAEVILLDIEGTIGPLSYVRDVLFPFARRNLREFLRRNGSSAGVASACAQIASDDLSAPQDLDGLTRYVEALMDQDSKATGLKALQGLIWKEGFEAGRLRSQLYADVPPFLRRRRAMGQRVAIYSSGSIEAQNLYLRYSDQGDQRPWVDAYFDTTSGSKKDAGSYARIADALRVQPSSIAFFSDVEAELAAARLAGVRPVLVRRAGNPPPASTEWLTISSFDDFDG